MPFFQSVAVRLGVQNISENMGIDPETAGWLGAVASLATALLTADLHGHLAGEAIAQGLHHATAHGVSHVAGSAVAHGTSQIAGDAVAHGTSQVAGHAVANNQALVFGSTWAETYADRAASYASNGNPGLAEYWAKSALEAERNGY